MEITITEVARDGQLRRRTVDTTGRADARRWEDLAERAAIGFPPPYRPAPGRPVFEVRVDDTTALIAEGDAIGALGELIAAVLREG